MDHPKTRTLLHSGWSFKQRNPEEKPETDFAGDGWRTAQVPGTAHTDLLAHGLIPDPFHGTNELDVQWVGETDWLYKLEFEIDEISSRLEGQTDLCFDGLDTFARIWLNGELILESDNFFVTYRVSVTQTCIRGNRRFNHWISS